LKFNSSQFHRFSDQNQFVSTNLIFVDFFGAGLLETYLNFKKISLLFIDLNSREFPRFLESEIFQRASNVSYNNSANLN